MLGWWRTRTQPERVDISTRWSIYLLFAFEPLALHGAYTGSGFGLRAATVVFVGVAHTAACLVLARHGVAVAVGAPRFPGRAVTVVVVLGGVLVAAGWGLETQPSSRQEVPPALQVIITAIVATSAALITVVPARHVWNATGVLLLLDEVLCVARGGENAGAVALGSSLALLAAVLTIRFSLWLLAVVQQLVDGQQAQAELAVAEERLRFARDLHDVLGRHLSAIAVKSELVAALTRRSDDRAADEALQVRAIAHETMQEVRAVAHGYREVSLDAELAGSRALLRSAGVRCVVEGSGSGWPARVQGALAWAVREGTTNVLRHSAARNCFLRLRQVDGCAELQMENDGVGATRDGDPVSGSGLAGLEERARALGGSVRVEGHGGRFRLLASVPLAEPQP